MHAWPGVSIPVLPGSPVPLRLYDTAAREVRPTAPGPVAKMYVCGITPYDATHLGHAATYVAFDLINRQWRDNGHGVVYVQNVTDVDDPLLERAAATGSDWAELAEREIALFRDDMTELRILAPQHFAGVVETIPLVVEQVIRLRESGSVYEVGDDLYFAIRSDPRFGQIAHLDSHTAISLFAERGGDPGRAGKRDPLDCVVWQAPRAGEPSWDSPLGPGRPGWHLECVAIALEFLGMSFDVQGGGSDLAFPHHEMGASQAQVATGQWPYARHYVHAGMVGLDGQKMSKSDGNLVFVARLRAEHDPMAIRLALLAHHYRDDWDWTAHDLPAAESRLAAWRDAVSLPGGPPADPVLAEVRALLADDLNAPAALRVIDAWATEQRVRGGSDPAAPGIISRLADALLGIAL